MMQTHVSTPSSADEVRELRHRGYLGPFESVVPEGDIEAVAAKLLSHCKNKDSHPLYGRYSVRDWHLVYPELINLVNHNSVLTRLRSIMGEDLILWRSNLFHKPPGTGPVGWHQEFGTFSGEDIGNNKPSLLPTHLSHLSEDTLAQYLPRALALESPQAAPDLSDFWDMTVWVALSEMQSDMGPLHFLPGSHRTLHPLRLVPLLESDFWQDPFVGIRTKEQLISACANSQLILDVDTSTLLQGMQVEKLTCEHLKEAILLRLQTVLGSQTVFPAGSEDQVAAFPVKKGEFMIFSERTMHGSSANNSSKERLAISFRITKSSTLVFPSRLRGDFVDGFNLNISRHSNILLSGKNLNPNNATRSMGR